MATHVREKPPLRLDYSIETPSGKRYHWSDQERDPANVPNDTRFSSVIPGGFESYDAKLPRKPGVDYADLEGFSTIRVHGPGGDLAGEYRLERSPRVAGNEMAVSPSAVGYQAALEDDKSAAEIYVDRDFSRWQTMSTQRRHDIITAAFSPGDSSTNDDSATGEPALVTEHEGAWAATAPPYGEGWYDAAAARIGSLSYAWKKSSTVSAAANAHEWRAALHNTDLAPAGDTSADLQAAGPGTGTVTATTATRRWAAVRFLWNAATAAGIDNAKYVIFWTVLAVYGDHGLTQRGTLSATAAPGFYASDVLAHAVGKWAPELRYTTGVDGTITDSTFVIEHLAFVDRTTAAEIIKAANRFHIHDWAVWDNKTFYYYPRGARGRSWRARVTPAQLEETGPQIDRLWESVIVQYEDVSGINKTVGPPGSNADTESDFLKDDDTENPANQLGIVRRDLLQMGTSTAAAATEVGARFLEEQKLLDTSGKATLVGHVEDDRGVLHPAWRVRAGDTITFVDAADPSPRRIVKADYNHDSRSCSVDLDSPPEGMAALLERLNVVLVPLGIGN